MEQRAGSRWCRPFTFSGFFSKGGSGRLDAGQRTAYFPTRSHTIVHSSTPGGHGGAARNNNQYRWTTVSKDKAFKPILNMPLLKTPPDLLLAVVKRGTVSTNVFLRRTQNFALGMGWLPWPVLRKKQFPKVRYKAKRGITAE